MSFQSDFRKEGDFQCMHLGLYNYFASPELNLRKTVEFSVKIRKGNSQDKS